MQAAYYCKICTILVTFDLVHKGKPESEFNPAEHEQHVTNTHKFNLYLTVNTACFTKTNQFMLYKEIQLSLPVLTIIRHT